VKVGYVLAQEQYLTVYKYNQLLLKLDLDNGVADNDYYSTLNAIAGDNLRNKLTLLATKLDNDSGLVTTTYAAAISGYTSSFSDTQLAYNAIVNLLNLDTGAQFSNYSLSSGTTTFESTIESIDSFFLKVTLQYALPLIEGSIKIYQSIPFSITFNVQPMGDPEVFKHVSEGKFIFDRTNFTKAQASFSTDLSASFEEIEFYKQGNGSFGYTEDNADNFGGNGDKTPFRTLIPRNKQRCRMIVPKFDHNIARERVTLLGYSVVYNEYSTRPYRG